MILRPNKLLSVLIIICITNIGLRSQPVPPVQTYVNNIGASPLASPATVDFAPTNITVEGWVYLTSYPNPGSLNWLFGKPSPSPVPNPNPNNLQPFGFGVTMASDGKSLMVWYANGSSNSGGSFISNTIMQLNVWTHLALVCGNGSVSLYMNGILAGTHSFTTLWIEPNVPIGFGQCVYADGSTGWPNFQGYFRDFRAWNIVRTQSQIVSNMNQTITPGTTGLIAEWPMNESSGSLAKDISGSNRNLVVCSQSATSISSFNYFISCISKNYTKSITSVPQIDISYINNGTLIDFNNDGYADLLLWGLKGVTDPATPAPLIAFTNNNGSFIETTATTVGIVNFEDPGHAHVADFNGDGLPDVFIEDSGPDTGSFPGGQSRLLLQTKQGTLVDATNSSLPIEREYTHGSDTGDLLLNGHKDILMINMIFGAQTTHGSSILINDGAGHFTEDFTRLPNSIGNISVSGYSSGAIADMNGDGYPDIILPQGLDVYSKPFQACILLNDKTGHFNLSNSYNLPAGPINNSVDNFVLACDLRKSGNNDLIIESEATYNSPSNSLPFALQVLLNMGNGNFKDISSNSGITFDPGVKDVYEIKSADINGDNIPDLIVYGGNARNRFASIFLGKGDGTFIDATAIFNPLNANVSMVGSADLFKLGYNGVLVVTNNYTSSSITAIEITKPMPISVLTSPLVAPTITSQPTVVSVKSGTSATLSVAATGADTIQYQWQKNGINIANAYSASYTIPAAQLSDGGIYSVLVGNAGGTTVSNYVPLSVTATGSPTITTNPSSQTITSGSTVVFKAAASSTTTATYQWYLNGVAITGATSSTLLIPGATSANVGTYNCTITNSAGSVTTTSAQLTLLTTSNPGRLVNLSVLTMDGPGSQMLTLGFVNGGAGTTGSEPLLIRASGPALTAFNVPTVLADPTLTLFQGSNVVVTNDNWGSSTTNVTAVNTAEAATGAFQLTPTTSLDAAVVQSLSSVQGGYTVQVQGNNNGVGNALAEVYDNTTNYTATSPRLVNLSCRQLVPANGTLTAGFVISGTTSKTVLIRASGPTLASYNVPGTMTDPQISVFSGTTVIASNAGWAGDTAIATAAANVGAFPYASNTSKDSAVLMTLAPGSYTVQATSVSGTAGVTLIEVYEVP